MEQNINQLTQEMTDFCVQKLTTENSLPSELKAAFVRTRGKLLQGQWKELSQYNQKVMTTLVMISLLVGEIDGPWWGAGWTRCY